MSSAKPIVIGRAIAETGLLEPVQCSENSQVAINNSDHITVLDPKLPLLHNWLNTGAPSSSNKNVIDPNGLYDVKSVFNISELESLGLQIFSRLLIEDGEDRFAFGRIAEPCITAHAWSPMVDGTKDCYLGVLLNTGEVLVLKRLSQDAEHYSVLFRSFTCLLDHLSIPQHRLTAEGDIIISNSESLELKITSFAFAKGADGVSYISLAHMNGHISIHHLASGLPEISRIDAGGTVVKQSVSTDSSKLALLRSDNSVITISLDQDFKVKGEPSSAKQSSRFLVSHLKFLSPEILIITDTRELHLSYGSRKSQIKLPHISTISGLSFGIKNSGYTVFLSYETGHLLSVDVSNDGQCSLLASSQAWTTFVNRGLNQFQQACIREQNKAHSNVFKTFLNDKIEGNFIVHGSNLTPNGCFVVAYSVAPKNVIHHEIRSKAEIRVGLIHSSELDQSLVTSAVHGTSLSQIHGSLIQDAQKFPTVDFQTSTAGEEALKDFVSSVFEWKLHHFGVPEKVTLNIKKRKTLKDTIIACFQQDKSVQQLQKLLTFNIAMMNSVEALISSRENSKVLDEALSAIKKEQSFIRSQLSTHIRQIVITHMDLGLFSSHSDKFIYLTSFKSLPTERQQNASRIPKEVTMTESTDIVTETFKVRLDQAVDEQFVTYAISESGHSWRRCDLTLLPILSLTNKCDELGQFVYASSSDQLEGLSSALQADLAYCIYSGNRIFDLKVGL
ncbi:hypothetical protein FT663_02458 [Candidozyma haemuli var. vulneris]|uniref:Transcription factor IIIC 90kDa subunit N-terminal domain-containing protein n=1 Tax=Candidozyma haemuli TaxID=45357 RepID=A0A2V1ATI2_9ASCO|nr:hypothetical protein CXQ85_002388 [[Candida] haemuloni]KAF3989888.1 hypothetical protein FT662_02566 [[Candida] haemuloni var. vulneris]KAF3992014.1 hypothetical protein FT663_02458 [[Candida] haemuloni var. vulneris]PVH20593.1 hypothetical protein CXQ85_002388 [[Candida] haemuloni]